MISFTGVNIRLEHRDKRFKGLKQTLTDHNRAGIRAMTNYVLRTARRRVSRPNPNRNNPSAPGEPPKMVTGRGRESIYASYSRAGTSTISVRASGEHMMRHETGQTFDGAIRPWLRPIFQFDWSKIEAAYKNAAQARVRLSVGRSAARLSE
jgi:hypothetical protein